ncbi:MAG: adenosine kinase [Bacteroidales bacterium]|nr:adenosine kinase [Bacteroidales bacterium]HOY38078.1 adenosine kinase [Bacteroidales bacterium]
MKKILAMGNALVDMMTQLPNDSILSDLALPKGSMQLVDATQSKQIQEFTKSMVRTRVSGGSAANTIRSIANLKAPCGYLGKVSNDELGIFFRNEMNALGINTLLQHSATPTGLAVALVSPDSERTFATYLGAAAELTPEELSKESMAGFDYLHIEGYLAFNHSLIKKAMEIARANNIIVSMDMASYNVVEINRDFLLDVIKNDVDIVFANEEEARALTGMGPEDAVHQIAEMCRIAIVKTGADGSLIKSQGQLSKIPARKTSPVDTTGAGDNYASGFLYGHANGWSLKKCGQLGTVMASRVIEVIGTTMSSETWEWINAEKECIAASGND